MNYNSVTTSSSTSSSSNTNYFNTVTATVATPLSYDYYTTTTPNLLTL